MKHSFSTPDGSGWRSRVFLVYFSNSSIVLMFVKNFYSVFQCRVVFLHQEYAVHNQFLTRIVLFY